MRKPVPAILRSGLVRLALGIALASLVAVGLYATDGPAPTVATPPTVPVPLTSAAFRTAVASNVALDAPVTLEFATPMDAVSVEASIRTQPSTDLQFEWDAGHRRLTLAPERAWRTDTLYTLTVDAGALAQTGRPLARPVRTAFLTRPATGGHVAATEHAGKRVTIDTRFEITFARPVEITSVLDGLDSVPPIVGRLEATGGLAAGTSFTFTPASTLQADTRYRLTVSGVRTADGEQLDDVVGSVRTVKAPVVVRMRPRTASSSVARDAAISVRFSESMHAGSTREALVVTVNGKAVAGRARFSEDNRVLVFQPRTKLPHDAKVIARVRDTARSAVGTPLAEPASISFRVAKKPIPKVVAPVASSPGPGGGSGGSGGGGGGTSGSLADVERYYLGLMNCTRTGGWVTSSGSCSSPGGRDVAVLKLDSGISSKVARPYAKLLATRNLCSHFANGGPDDRLRRAGYSSYRWAENIGCRSGNARSAVLATHLFFQSEKSYNGGHWVNMTSSKYSRVGIGVWSSGGRVRLVVDFYRP